MEENITLHKRAVVPSWDRNFSLACALRRLVRASAAPVEWLRQYYSSVLGREVPVGLALRYTHAQVAFALAAFPSYGSLLAHAAAAAWFGVAVVMCRRGAAEK